MKSDAKQLLAIALALADILDEVPEVRDTSGGPRSVRAHIDETDRAELISDDPWNAGMFREWRVDLRFALYQWAERRPPYLPPDD